LFLKGFPETGILISLDITKPPRSLAEKLALFGD
jgi:hypothetical protein